jgi:hypothetical protein
MTLLPKSPICIATSSLMEAPHLQNHMCNLLSSSSLSILKRLSGPHSSPATYDKGARGSVVVKALCYKPEGRGFETR